MIIALALTLALSATGCARAISDEGILTTAIPPWPVGGKKVAAEMDAHCPVVRDDKGNIVSQVCPATDDWHERLGRLKDKLEILRNPKVKVSEDGRVQQ